jgi:type II secretory pathway component GspD/PulD (secretin)
MKTIIKLTLAATLIAGTTQAFAQQDDPLARLRAQRALEQQQLGGQPADAATPEPDAGAQLSPTDAPATPQADGASSQDDPLARLKAQRALEQSGGQPADAAPAPDMDAATPAQAESAAPMPVPAYTASGPATLSTNGITLNFRNAPLNDVLTYMSDAAGFIIVLNVPVNSRVTVISTHPMSKDEAVDVLNTVLNQNGLAAIRDDRTLTIMNKSDAGRQIIPVMEGNDYKIIPKNAEIVTQIIPIRFVDAEQLVVDISPFTQQALSVVANQAGNSIIVTDTQANIRHLMQIIQSIDSSAQMETSVQVFPLKYANPNDVVAMLSAVFPSSTGGSQTINVGGRGGRGGGGGNPFAALFGGGGGAANSGGTSAQRVQKAQQVLAVADGRTQSVIITAAKDMMPQIKDMIAQVDIQSDRDTDVYTVPMHNADPYQAAAVLQGLFQGNNATRSTSTTTGTDPLTTRAQQMSTSSSSSSSGFGTSSGSTRGGGF